MLFTETMLAGYAQPLSQAEDQRCRNAINMVRDALKSIGYTTPHDIPRTLVTDTHEITVDMVAKAIADSASRDPINPEQRAGA